MSKRTGEEEHGLDPQTHGEKTHGFRGRSSTALNYKGDAVDEVLTGKQLRFIDRRVAGKGGAGENLWTRARSRNSSADIGAGSLWGGCPEHCGGFSIIPSPHPFNARSTLSVTTTDIPRYHLVSLR